MEKRQDTRKRTKTTRQVNVVSYRQKLAELSEEQPAPENSTSQKANFIEQLMLDAAQAAHVQQSDKQQRPGEQTIEHTIGKLIKARRGLKTMTGLSTQQTRTKENSFARKSKNRPAGRSGSTKITE